MAKKSIRKEGGIMGKHRYINNCEICNECEYIGEGDFACMMFDHPVIVKEDWGPTEYYSNCKMCREYFPKGKDDE